MAADDLVVRLLAAIDEVEEFARDAMQRRWLTHGNYIEDENGGEVARFNLKPQAVLRLCQAHRDIVADYEHTRQVSDRLIERDCEVGTRVVQQRAVNALERVLRALARGYGLEDRGDGHE